MTITKRIALTGSIERRIRQDGGDAETGRGMDLGTGLVLADSVTGLAVDIRLRRLLVHQAEEFAESGMSISVSYTPTASTPLGFTARVTPAWGGESMSGAQALWSRETMVGMGQDPLMNSGASGSTPSAATGCESVHGSSVHRGQECARPSTAATTESATGSRYSSKNG